MNAQVFYDGLGCDYDLMVAWEERLAREESFFSRLFAERGSRRVLDAACGTGMHVIAFTRAGRDCTGADLSPVMVEKARQNARDAGVAARFEVAGFGGLVSSIGGHFDAVTCIGNSLPHLLDDESLRACLADFAALLVPGGILVIQNRNYDRLLRERQRLMPPVSRVEAEGETVFLRITEYPPAGAVADEVVDFTLLTLRKRLGEWSLHAQNTPLRAMRRSTLESELKKAGFAAVRAYGSYAFDEFDAAGSSDLVIVATR
jgi:glycine/sarcosine N-methyltransferase